MSAYDTQCCWINILKCGSRSCRKLWYGSRIYFFEIWKSVYWFKSYTPTKLGTFCPKIKRGWMGLEAQEQEVVWFWLSLELYYEQLINMNAEKVIITKPLALVPPSCPTSLNSQENFLQNNDENNWIYIFSCVVMISFKRIHFVLQVLELKTDH